MTDLTGFLLARLADDEAAARECAEVWTAPGSVTCPACGRTSYHPDDVRYGYCGACHESTSPPRIEEGSEP